MFSEIHVFFLEKGDEFFVGFERVIVIEDFGVWDIFGARNVSCS